jgi:hypothetical protein
MNFESIERLLRHHAFMEGMTDEQVRFMLGCMRNIRYPAGDCLFRDGSKADTLFLLRGGRVALEVQSPGIGARQLETFGEGDVLGWSVLFPPPFASRRPWATASSYPRALGAASPTRWKWCSSWPEHLDRGTKEAQVRRAIQRNATTAMASTTRVATISPELITL